MRFAIPKWLNEANTDPKFAEEVFRIFGTVLAEKGLIETNKKVYEVETENWEIPLQSGATFVYRHPHVPSAVFPVKGWSKRGREEEKMLYIKVYAARGYYRYWSSHSGTYKYFYTVAIWALLATQEWLHEGSTSPRKWLVNFIKSDPQNYPPVGADEIRQLAETAASEASETLERLEFLRKIVSLETIAPLVESALTKYGLDFLYVNEKYSMEEVKSLGEQPAETLSAVLTLGFNKRGVETDTLLEIHVSVGWDENRILVEVKITDIAYRIKKKQTYAEFSKWEEKGEESEILRLVEMGVEEAVKMLKSKANALLRELLGDQNYALAFGHSNIANIVDLLRSNRTIMIEAFRNALDEFLRRYGAKARLDISLGDYKEEGEGKSLKISSDIYLHINSVGGGDVWRGGKFFSVFLRVAKRDDLGGLGIRRVAVTACVYSLPQMHAERRKQLFLLQATDDFLSYCVFPIVYEKETKGKQDLLVIRSRDELREFWSSVAEEALDAVMQDEVKRRGFVAALFAGGLDTIFYAPTTTGGEEKEEALEKGGGRFAFRIAER